MTPTTTKKEAAVLQGQAGRAPGAEHFANLPFASLHRFGLASDVGHLTNRPLASLHGAASAGAASIADAANAAIRNFIGLSFIGRLLSESAGVRLHLLATGRHNSFGRCARTWSHP